MQTKDKIVVFSFIIGAYTASILILNRIGMLSLELYYFIPTVIGGIIVWRWILSAPSGEKSKRYAELVLHPYNFRYGAIASFIAGIIMILFAFIILFTDSDKINEFSLLMFFALIVVSIVFFLLARSLQNDPRYRKQAQVPIKGSSTERYDYSLPIKLRLKTILIYALIIVVFYIFWHIYQTYDMHYTFMSYGILATIIIGIVGFWYLYKEDKKIRVPK